MKNQTKQVKIKYFAYLRKSSESEDKQVQSIDAQRRELSDYAKENELEIVDWFEESQSAKAPGRPVFTDMIKKVNKGEADGLLVWKLNRLARNPIDGGTISWMLQQRILKHIQTHGRGYYPEDNVIVMAVELGMANQFVRDLSTDTKRGIRERAEKGYPTGVAPIGFRNDLLSEPGDRGWLVDTERFELVRQMLEEFLTGRYSIRDIMEFANDKLGLRTTPHKRQGGKKLGISYVCDTILKNPIFAGFFITRDGTRHELNNGIPRMITEDKYWQIQKILGSRGRCRPSKNIHIFAYVGPTKCGSCNGSVTAEHKNQLICSQCKHKFAYSNKICCPKCDSSIEEMVSPLYLHYVYYHCTKKKNPNCTEGSVSESYIDGHLSSYYKENLQISDSLNKWCKENIEQLGVSDYQNQSERRASLEKMCIKKENELKELSLMRARNILNDDEFLGLKSSLGEEIRGIRTELQNLGHVDPERLNRAQRAFNLAVGVAEIFKSGTVSEKKEALSEIGSNLTLKDKKLNVSNVNLFSIIINGLLRAKTKNPQFEPESIVDTSRRNEVFVDVCPTLLLG